MVDALTAARYPFLPEAAVRIEDEGLTLEEVLQDPVYARVRRRARDRVLAAVAEGALPPGGLNRASAPVELLEDTLAYVVGRILVSATGDAYVVRRHALAEAVRVKAFLDDEDDPDAIVRVAEALDIEVTHTTGREYRMHFAEYLKYATFLKDTTWKLVNQPLTRGVVPIQQEKVARLCQEALRRRIENELPKPVPDDVRKLLSDLLVEVEDAARERKAAFQSEGFGETDLECMPPCQKQILAMLQRGENAPHSARFAVTSFLHTIGLESEDIMKLFATAPDFREDLTRYQVEHITGASSSTEYSPPGCQAMKTYGICYNEDNWCRSARADGERIVGHPLTYYRWMLRRKHKGLRIDPPPEPRKYEDRGERGGRR